MPQIPTDNHTDNADFGVEYIELVAWPNSGKLLKRCKMRLSVLAYERSRSAH
jgi:hypothetical protein